MPSVTAACFVLSLYVFSTENFSRDAKEVGYLMDLFCQ